LVAVDRREERPDALLFGAVALVGTVLLVGVRYAFHQDAWLALTAGREVWNGGIPHHDTLTAMTSGRRWIDEQWLSQLAIYGLFRLGGLPLVAVGHVALVVTSLYAAVAAGRRLGADRRTLALLLFPCALLVLLAPVRTQPYAYPMFVATVYLLARDSRSPEARVYWTLPLLVLWANVHGSAVLGAGLVALRGLTILAEHWRGQGRPRGGRLAGVMLTIAAPLCLFATPYGIGTARYYGATLLNHDFAKLVSEWKPVTSVAIAAVPLFVLAGLALWSMGRHPNRSTPWERIALLVVLIAAIAALRNVVWAGFAVLILPAISLASDSVRDSPRPRLDRAIALVGAAAISLAVITTLARPDRDFEPRYPAGALRAVEQATRDDPQLSVFADPRFADWLLWRAPRLRHRVAFDIRFELQPPGGLERIARTLKATGVDWKHAARGFRLVVLAPGDTPDSARGFRMETGRRILFQDDDALVILRTPSAAG
jgi:hypothetical protein